MTRSPAIYDTIGVGYDTTRRPDPRIADRIHALLQPQRHGKYLDVASGTGNYTYCLSGKGIDIVGVDQSPTMLSAAREKYPAITWHQGDVSALPFADASFDGAVCTQAIHHFPDLGKAFAEIGRVMRNGRLVIFGSGREQIRRYWLNAYFPIALARAAEQQPSDDEIETALTSARLRVVAKEPWLVPSDPIDLFLYSGKHRPEMYLDDRVRRGISTFASLADETELADGLRKLRADIGTGEITRIMRHHPTVAGDYQFIVAEAAR